MVRARLIEDGDEQIVLLPPGFELPGDYAYIHRDGEYVVLSPVTAGEAAPEEIET